MEFKKPDQPTAAELREVLSFLKSMDTHKRFNKMLYFEPEAKQRKFFDLGAEALERGILAGNRTGKSEGAAYEVAVHMTGDYPDDWKGARFDHPVKGWVAGLTAQKNREVGQTKLCGQFGVAEAFGTGFIPKDRFATKPSLAAGVRDTYDTIQVIHKTDGVEDGISIASFKSYDQGREKFQGEALDFCWCDEEPDMDIYSECMTRLEGIGQMMLTFTALNGLTDVYKRFRDTPTPQRQYVTISLDEVTHFTEKQKATMLEQYPKHERNTRRYGLPMSGSGRVFTIDEEVIKEPTIPFGDIPGHWAFIWGIDFGISKNHAFGAVLLGLDREADIVHILHAIKLADQQPIHHSTAILNIASEVPVAWPQDGTQRVAGDTAVGKHLHAIYRGFNLKMLPMHAQWAEGGVSTEAAVKDMDQRISTGRLKVSAHLAQWFEEYRQYHREAKPPHGIAHVDDDLMGATQKGLMMLRYARSAPLGNKLHKRIQRSSKGEKPDFEGGCIGVDFDMF
jgi:phage terminase large subunit-like protein